MTVLIIGGAYQGKRKVAENLYADLPRIENLHEIVRKMLKEEKWLHGEMEKYQKKYLKKFFRF